MIKTTFLAHSGFLVELPELLLLFDWWKGDLPELPAEKPLLVFASHSHGDHFNPQIFTLDDGSRPIRFVFGQDIRLSPNHRKHWGITTQTAAKCTRMWGLNRLEPMEGVTVEALPSTDAGVAFLVTAQGKTIYHSGDLNWWHWAEEPDPWNPDMEKHFKEYIEPLRNRDIDLAMFPLDPRLEGAEDWGLHYFLELTRTRWVLPMHQWGDYSPTPRFTEHYPQWADHIVPITAEGQVNTFE